MCVVAQRQTADFGDDIWHLGIIFLFAAIGFTVTRFGRRSLLSSSSEAAILAWV
jgi:hypothetical protein